MREILDLCERMDQLALETYTQMAVNCTDESVSLVLEQLARDEAEHVEWWQELLAAWDNGLLPDIYPDSGEAQTQLAEILASLKAAVPEPGEPISPDDALTTAVSIEFFMLDAMFGELLDLAEPAVGKQRRDEYDRHIERLIEAVEDFYPERALSGFLARVLRRSCRENRALAMYALRDPLTGLGNRRAFGAQIRQMAAWSARYGRPLTVLLIDIDNFKSVNDTYGHVVGDEVLSAVAASMAGATRASDMAARYGGDEFAIIAPETGPEDAHMLAERVLAAVRSVEVTADGKKVRPTASAGVTVMIDPPDSDPRRVEELLAMADQGLYAAKRAGRDRVTEPLLLTDVT